MLSFLTGRRSTSKRSGKGDPFLEFRSEPGPESGLLKTMAPAPNFPERSAISPAVAFALGVAGLVTAVVAYYQLVQVLATSRTVQVATTSSAPVGAPVAPVAPSQTTATPAPAPVLSPIARPVAPAPPAQSGWLVLQSSVELQVFEGKRLLGSSKNTRLELPEGSHTLTLVNDALEIRQTMPIAVTANRTTQRPFTVPTGSISLSALPWAQAWIDGVPVGTTPLANIPLPVGVHEIVWTHPSLGERRQSVIAKAKTPLRVGVDFTK